MFSGPVLALCAQGDAVLVGRGPYVNRGAETICALPTATVHGIKNIVGGETIVFGGRELKIGNIFIQTRDWILDVHVTDELILVAVMHNRLEVYSFTDGKFLGVVDSPNHALLYSACVYMENPSTLCFVGGGVMCDMHFWSVSLTDFRVVNHRIVSHHKGSIFRIRFSDQFGTIVSTSDDRSVCVWTQSDEGWEVSQTLLGHQARVWDAVHVTRDVIATSCEDGLIRIFESGNLIRTLSGHERDVRVLATGHGMSLYSGGEDGSVRKWNLQPDIVHAFDWSLDSPTDDWIRGIHLLSESEMVVASNFGSFFRVSQGGVSSSVTCDTGKAAVVCSTLVGGQFLIAGLSDGSIVVWNLNASELIRLNSVVSVRCASVFADGDSDSVIVANHCGEVVLVDLTSRDMRSRIHLTRSSKPSGKLSCFLRVNQEMIFGDDKGFIYTVGAGGAVESYLVSRSDKVVSLECSNNDSSVIVNMNNGTSVEFNLLGREIGKNRKKSGFTSFVCQSANPGIGFSSTDFFVHDSTGIQFQYACGGHRRPFDYQVSVEKSQVVFAFGVNNRTARFVTSPFISETVIQGCNGDLIHGIVPLGGNRFMTANEDNKLRIIGSDMEVDIVAVHEGSIRAIARVGDFIVSGGARSQIVLSRIDEAGPVMVVQSLNLPGEDDVRIMGIAGIGNEFLAVTSACEIYRFSVSLSGFTDVEQIPVPPAVSASVLLSVVADTESFCIGSGNGYLLSLGKSGVSACNRVHQSGVNAIVTTPDYFISAGDDQSVCVTRKEDLEVVSRTELASACSIRALAVGIESNRIFSTGTDRLLSEWSLDETGKLSLVSQRKLAVTDPLSLLTTPNASIIVGGRGLQILD